MPVVQQSGLYSQKRTCAISFGNWVKAGSYIFPNGTRALVGYSPPTNTAGKAASPMLRAYLADGSVLEIDVSQTEMLPAEAVYVDLLHPTREEEALVESAFNLSVPTREDMVEIEPSSRLYRENDALHLTASIMCAG